MCIDCHVLSTCYSPILCYVNSYCFECVSDNLPEDGRLKNGVI